MNTVPPIEFHFDYRAPKTKSPAPQKPLSGYARFVADSYGIGVASYPRVEADHPFNPEDLKVILDTASEKLEHQWTPLFRDTAPEKAICASYGIPQNTQVKIYPKGYYRECTSPVLEIRFPKSDPANSTSSFPAQDLQIQIYNDTAKKDGGEILFRAYLKPGLCHHLGFLNWTMLKEDPLMSAVLHCVAKAVREIKMVRRT